MYFIELQEFGWNWLTASFILLSALTTWQWRAYILQARKIWKHESAKSVSIIMFTFQFFVTVTGVVYGFTSHSLTITYASSTCLVLAFVARGAWKFKLATKWDKLVLGLCITGVLLHAGPLSTAFVYSAFIFGGMFPFFAQLWELYKSKSRGDLHGEWLFALLVKSALWSIFAYTARDPVYMVFAPIILVLVTWITYLWWHYGRKEEHREEVVVT